MRCGGVNGEPRATSWWPTRRASWSFPAPVREQTLLAAQAKLAKEADESLEAWEQAHRARIDKILSENGFTG